ncbi:hypothetical protein MNBD_GAMMA15-1883 [hydrothermal vent metagenome]|uniref:Glycine zipper 2TM domain-containing protein n=1 Tax=hydrothermal vent metagenome TaxID=652676 RepID=A0A3B0YB02_9ZZZZ
MMRSLIGLLLTLSLLATGCTSTRLTGDSYSRQDARSEQQVRYARILELRDVVIEGTQSGVGSIAGAAVGGVGASTIGHGKTSAVAGILGAVVGGVAGSKIEDAATRVQGVEITLQYDDDHSVVAIVQEVSADTRFQVGTRVRVLNLNGQTRVTPSR